jgi:hypothetical protein
VRTLAEPGFGGEPVGANIKSINSFLVGQGFKRFAFVTWLNPKIGNAIHGCQVETLLPPHELSFVKMLHHDLEDKKCAKREPN